ncbi:hypothetical protein OUZ56_029464 [Daphnia magna]|uniref:Uncharacterized protein n=1 Tax=Daphnia magna TaxID=35525 RepID=A0ABR0B6X0_9CRUS|nr:hypothetical protein OUZ56_029464 [Daphnia magna]
MERKRTWSRKIPEPLRLTRLADLEVALVEIDASGSTQFVSYTNDTVSFGHMRWKVIRIANCIRASDSIIVCHYVILSNSFRLSYFIIISNSFTTIFFSPF